MVEAATNSATQHRTLVLAAHGGTFCGDQPPTATESSAPQRDRGGGESDTADGAGQSEAGRRSVPWPAAEGILGPCGYCRERKGRITRVSDDADPRSRRNRGSDQGLAVPPVSCSDASGQCIVDIVLDHLGRSGPDDCQDGLVIDVMA